MLPAVVAFAALAAALLPTTARAQNPCSFVPDSFACSIASATSYVQQCACFSCKETDGVGFYQCNGATVCASNYTSTSVKNTTPEWSLSAYVSVGIVFVVVSVLVYAALRVLARFTRVIEDDADKDPDAPETRRRDRTYRYLYDWAFGTLYKSDGAEKRSFGEFCIASCELLDCVWPAAQRKEWDAPAWRPFYLRAARLLATLSVGASLGVFLGSLDFDATKCYTHTAVSLCAVASDANVTTITCDDDAAVLDGESLISASSIVAFVATQGVKYVGSYAQTVGAPRSTLDLCAHALWLLVALAAFPVSYSVSSGLLSPNAYDHKTSALRVRLVVAVTLSTWIKDQALDFVRAPAAFGIKRLTSRCFTNPHENDKKQTVEPMPLELAPPNYTGGGGGVDEEENVLDDSNLKVDPKFLELDYTDGGYAGKLDAIASPRPTTTMDG